MQDDDGPPLRVEMVEGIVEEFAVGDGRSNVIDRRRVDRGQLHLDSPTAPTSRDIDAGMDDELAQPCVELVRVAKGRQVPPGADKAFLDGVTREFRITEDQASGGIESCDRGAGERGEGVMIALPCPFDEVSLVHDCPTFGARPSVALTW